jgi:hypothetical protein
MIITINMTGPMACGKTRATKAIEAALKEQLPDKTYSVHWAHKLPNGTISENGSFNHVAGK